MIMSSIRPIAKKITAARASTVDTISVGTFDTNENFIYSTRTGMNIPIPVAIRIAEQMPKKAIGL